MPNHHALNDRQARDVNQLASVRDKIIERIYQRQFERPHVYGLDLIEELAEGVMHAATATENTHRG